jgi:hypothetical protein
MLYLTLPTRPLSKIYPGWDSTDPAQGPGYIPTTDTDHYNPIGTFGSDDVTRAQSASDFAIIDTSYTFSSWMDVLLNYAGGVVTATGYPAIAGGLQTDRVGTVSADPSFSVLDYGTLSTSAGNSGGPLWLDFNGSGGAVSAIPGPSWHAIGTGGGGSDILFQNTSGQISIWEMDGNTRIGGEAVSANPGPSWRAVDLT